MSRVRCIVALTTIVTWTTITLGIPAPASSHTDLIASTPSDGSRISSAPAEIALEFNADVRSALATVTLTIGQRRVGNLAVTAGERPTLLVAGVDGASLPADVSGDWRLAYRVTSDDGHPITGTLNFTVRIADSSAPATSRAESAPPRPLSRNDRPSDAIGATALIGLLAGLAAVLGCGLLVRARRRGDS